MKKNLAAAILLLCFAITPANAQSQPDSDTPKSPDAPVLKSHSKIPNKKFWIFAGLQIGTTIADIETTQLALSSNPQSHELNPLFGSHPGRPRMYSIGMALTGIQLLLQHHVKARSERTGRAKGLWIVGASVNTSLHTFLAVHNARIAGESVCPAQGAGCR
ncbi:MAG TPA: hypothetical protein VN822_03140 [Candidatus Acidoferrales bacterium]|nr:hypothetical protein [Candidatus Acidoferrales bacterium]